MEASKSREVSPVKSPIKPKIDLSAIFGGTKKQPVADKPEIFDVKFGQSPATPELAQTFG